MIELAASITEGASVSVFDAQQNLLVSEQEETIQDARGVALNAGISHAVEQGAEVRLVITEPTGKHSLLIGPDGMPRTDDSDTAAGPEEVSEHLVSEQDPLEQIGTDYEEDAPGLQMREVTAEQIAEIAAKAERQAAERAALSEEEQAPSQDEVELLVKADAAPDTVASAEDSAAENEPVKADAAEPQPADSNPFLSPGTGRRSRTSQQNEQVSSEPQQSAVRHDEAQPSSAEPQVQQQEPVREAPKSSAPFSSAGSPGFLVRDHVPEVRPTGWRAMAAALGLKVTPNPADVARAENQQTVRRQFTGAKTITVMNTKGGAGKTPTVVMLSAMLAREIGGSVAAWDNNETAGNLASRTVDSKVHERNAVDLAAEADKWLKGTATAAELMGYLHHQPEDRFDALFSRRALASDRHLVTAEEVKAIHQVLSRYYRYLVIDTGNNDMAENAVAARALTDQLVIPVTTVDDRAQQAWQNLNDLEACGGHEAQLAKNAVVIVSESQQGAAGLAQEFVDAFSPRVREVVRVPFDQGLWNGRIRVEGLSRASQDAWLAATAAVVRGL